MEQNWPKEWTQILDQSLESQITQQTDWEKVKSRAREKKRLLILRSWLGGLAVAAVVTWGLVGFLLSQNDDNEMAFTTTSEYYTESTTSTYGDLDEIFYLTASLIAEE